MHEDSTPTQHIAEREGRQEAGHPLLGTVPKRYPTHTDAHANWVFFGRTARALEVASQI